MLHTLSILIIVLCGSIDVTIASIDASVRINKCCESNEVLVVMTCVPANGTGEQ